MPAGAGVRPIETCYKGYRFRSRLEARYAVFMDAMKVEWQYEPEGFELPSGRYLPDFFLPQVNGGTWLEIKQYGMGYFGFLSCQGAPELSDPRLCDFSNFAASKGQDFFVAYGIPSQDYFNELAAYESEGMLEGHGSRCDPYQWCVCGCGKTVGIQFDGRGDRVGCKHRNCRRSDHGDKGYSHDDDLIVRAAQLARQARFEHGETP